MKRIKMKYPGASVVLKPDEPKIIYLNQTALNENVPAQGNAGRKKTPDPKQLPYPENLLTEIGLERIFKTGVYSPLTEDQMRGLEYAMQSLTEKERRAVKLRYENHLTFKQAAELCQITPEAVRQSAYYGVRKLRHPRQLAYYRNGYKVETGRRAKRVERDPVTSVFNGNKISWDLAERISIYDLNLLPRISLPLLGSGIENLAQLLHAMENPDELLKIKHFGPVRLREVKEKLRQFGAKI